LQFADTLINFAQNGQTPYENCWAIRLIAALLLWGQWRKWQLRPSLPVPVFLRKSFVPGRDA